MRRALRRRVANARRMMSLLSPPPIQRGGPQPPDDVDKILRAFFRRQMPDPWPSLEAPVLRRIAPAPVAKPARRWPLLRSRLALAASVALLATGLFFLAEAFQGRPHPPGPGVSIGPGSASRKNGIDGVVDPSPVPDKLKINESLIQEPSGTTIKVDVIVWSLPPK
jgi:hypothetical protein